MQLEDRGLLRGRWYYCTSRMKQMLSRSIFATEISILFLSLFWSVIFVWGVFHAGFQLPLLDLSSQLVWLFTMVVLLFEGIVFPLICGLLFVASFFPKLRKGVDRIFSLSEYTELEIAKNEISKKFLVVNERISCIEHNGVIMGGNGVMARELQIPNLDSPELYRSAEESRIRNEFAEHFRRCPIPGDEIMQNLGLFLTSKNLSRILFMDFLYRQIIDVQGIVVEFGTRWGQNIALFSAMRGIYEPFNRHRKVVGFDTFTGFTGMGDKDVKSHKLIKKGGFPTTENYVEYLEKTMRFIEQDNPVSHIQKFELRAGDAVREIDKYLREYPETIVALAYFDFDIYKPTKKCLEAIRPHLTKGSVLGFDELSDHDSPGETRALVEVFGLNNIRVRRYPFTSRVSYFVVE